MEYQNRKTKYSKLLNKKNKASNIMSRIRMVEFLTGFIFFGVLLYRDLYAYSFIAIGITLVVFIILVVKHEDIKRDITQYSNLYDINNKSIERLEDRWIDFADNGEEYIDTDHEYSFDLDIFGKGSLFQWINVTETFSGRNALRDLIIKPDKEAAAIAGRQDAISELAGRIDFRQGIQAEGMSIKGNFIDPGMLIEWAEDKITLIKSKVSIYFIRLLPVMTISSIVLAAAAGAFPKFIPLTLIIIQMVIIAMKSKKIIHIFTLTEQYKDDIKVYLGLIKLFEDEDFSSRYMCELKSRLADKKGSKACLQIKRLESIVDYMNLRKSTIHFIINILTLWDFHCVISLEGWKKRNGSNLREWFNTVGIIEALNSFAIIPYDNPDWAIPRISKENHVFESVGMGHPLLPKNNCVYNDFSMSGAGKIIIITGSNMSGKSTMLRTLGINLVLAYAGAKVCAGSMDCSVLDIYTSMRIYDDLERSISSFYAELIRVRMIIDAAKEKNGIIFLIDEVFKGTNTRDRKVGARALIRHLSQSGIMGLIATHDVELAELESDREISAENYYFREDYVEDKLHFDYKIREGVSNTANAIYLLKMIGIDID